MVGTTPHDIRRTNRSILWSKSIIPADHFLIKFMMIQDQSLEQEQMTNQKSAYFAGTLIKTKITTYH
jgi:hypothetical protein